MKEINENNLEEVTGGNYHIYSNDKITFDTITGSGFLRPGARYQAMEIMDGLINRFATVEEYDRACLAALREAGLLVE